MHSVTLFRSFLSSTLCLSAVAICAGCAVPPDDAEEDVGAARQALATTIASSQARDTVWTLSVSERNQLASYTLAYLDDMVVDDHMMLIDHSDAVSFFDDHRTYLQGLESYLATTAYPPGGWLPRWDPATTIPVPLRAVDAEDDGTPRAALTNPSPGIAIPAGLVGDAVCQYDTIEDLYSAVNGWHGSVHITVGGTMSDIMISPAAVIFWPWHTTVDEIYERWQSCTRFPSPMADDSTSGWSTTGSGAITVSTDATITHWPDYISIADTGSTTTRMIRDVDLSTYATLIDAGTVVGRVLAFTKQANSACTTGQPVVRVEYMSGSTILGYDYTKGTSTTWSATEAGDVIPSGTRKARIHIYTSSKSGAAACAGQYAQFDRARFALSAL